MARKSKKQAQRIHAKRRLADRYGLELNRHAIRELTKKVSSDTFLLKQSNRVTIHLLRHDGRLLLSVYDKSRQTIVTFLPLDANIVKRNPHVQKKIKKAHEDMGLEYSVMDDEVKSIPSQSAS